MTLYPKNLHLKPLKESKNLNIYAIFGSLFGWLMRIIYNMVKDYGAAIMIFTIITRVFMFPITYKQQISSERMKAINPKIQKLRKAYANNPQKFQQEQMKLYQEEHISMMGGCLPALIQMPLLLGVMDVVYRPLTHILRIPADIIAKAREISIENGITFSGKNDLRAELKIMDTIRSNGAEFTDKVGSLVNDIAGFNNKLFGIADLTGIPTLKPDSWTAETVILASIPFMAGIFQLISSIYTMGRQKQAGGDMPNMGTMKAMMYVMPVVSVIFAFQVPAGVGFYWAIGALTTFIIQFCLQAYLNPERVAVIIDKEKARLAKKKPSKFQEAMRRQQELLAQQNGGSASVSELDDENSKLSRREKQELENRLIDEARKRIAEKYGDE